MKGNTDLLERPETETLTATGEAWEMTPAYNTKPVLETKTATPNEFGKISIEWNLMVEVGFVTTVIIKPPGEDPFVAGLTRKIYCGKGDRIIIHYDTFERIFLAS